MRESPEQGETIEMTSREGTEKKLRSKRTKEHMAEMAGLYRKRKWGKGREVPGMERFREEGRGEEQREAIGTG